MSSNELFSMIFVIILLFTLKKIKNIFEARKKLVGEVVSYELRGRKILLLMSLFLVGFGSVYAIQMRDLFSVVYVLIGISYSVVATDKVKIGENAICYDGKFLEFKHIKKWETIGSKYLDITHTTNNKEEKLLIPLNADSVVKISEIIKNKKNNKSNKKAKSKDKK